MLPTVFIDIDNTLIVPHHKLSNRNLKALQNYLAAGGEVVFATGKIPVALYNLIERLEVKDRYHIGGNGAVLFNLAENKRELLAHVGNQAEKILLKSRQLNINGFFYTDEALYYSDENYQGERNESFTALEEPIPQAINDIDFNEIVKVLFFVDATDITFENHLRFHYEPLFENLNFVRTADYLLEIHHKNQTKGLAASRYAEIFELDLKDAYAIGDSDNDLPLLQAVGHPYIVENASETLKKHNFSILPSCADDGVAFLLNQLLTQSTLPKGK